jgi:aminoglycoside phosphotransferase (APT) family kinase protein
VFDEHDTSKVLAVLDWELSTIGDPLADLAYACMCYHLPPVCLPLLGCRSSCARAAVPATDEDTCKSMEGAWQQGVAERLLRNSMLDP